MPTYGRKLLSMVGGARGRVSVEGRLFNEIRHPAMLTRVLVQGCHSVSTTAAARSPLGRTGLGHARCCCPPLSACTPRHPHCTHNRQQQHANSQRPSRLKLTPPAFPHRSCTLSTLWTIGMSLPLILKTTISPTRMGVSVSLFRNRMSPRWKAGRILPLHSCTHCQQQQQQQQHRALTGCTHTHTQGYSHRDSPKDNHDRALTVCVYHQPLP